MKVMYPWSIEPQEIPFDEVPVNPIAAYKMGWRLASEKYDNLIREIYEKIVKAKEIIEDTHPDEILEDIEL